MQTCLQSESGPAHRASGPFYAILLTLIALGICLYVMDGIISGHPNPAPEVPQIGDDAAGLDEVLRLVDARIREFRARKADTEARLRSNDLAVSLSERQRAGSRLNVRRLREESAQIEEEIRVLQSSLDQLHRLRLRLVQLQGQILRSREPHGYLDERFLVEIERFLSLEFEHGRPSLAPLLDLTDFDRLPLDRIPDIGREGMNESTQTLDELSLPTQVRLREMDVVFDAQLETLNLAALGFPSADVRAIRAHLLDEAPSSSPDIRPLVGGVPREEIDLDSREAPE